MAKVGIVTDSISCLPPEKFKEYDIRVVPVALNINGKPYRDVNPTMYVLFRLNKW